MVIFEKISHKASMEKILVEVESPDKARELVSILSALSFVNKVSAIQTPKSLIAALKEHELIKKAIVRKKNIAIAKYL